MTQKQRLIEIFRLNGFQMTLGKLLQYPEGYKCTSRFSELRDDGYNIQCVKGKRPTENLYIMQPPEKSGQMRLNV